MTGNELNENFTLPVLDSAGRGRGNPGGVEKTANLNLPSSAMVYWRFYSVVPLTEASPSLFCGQYFNLRSEKFTDPSQLINWLLGAENTPASHLLFSVSGLGSEKWR